MSPVPNTLIISHHPLFQYSSSVELCSKAHLASTTVRAACCRVSQDLKCWTPILRSLSQSVSLCLSLSLSISLPLHLLLPEYDCFLHLLDLIPATTEFLSMALSQTCQPFQKRHPLGSSGKPTLSRRSSGRLASMRSTRCFRHIKCSSAK